MESNQFPDSLTGCGVISLVRKRSRFMARCSLLSFEKMGSPVFHAMIVNMPRQVAMM